MFLLSGCPGQANFAFVVDLSGSIMDESHIPLELNFTYTVISGLDVANDNARVAVVTFANTVRDIIYFSDFIGNPQALLDALRFYLPQGGTTNTQAALAALRLQVFGAGELL